MTMNMTMTMNLCFVFMVIGCMLILHVTKQLTPNKTLTTKLLGFYCYFAYTSFIMFYTHYITSTLFGFLRQKLLNI